MKTSKILIVEDETIVAQSIGVQLEQLGYDVAGMVATAADAIAAVESTQPDLVLMDIVPDIDMEGIEAARLSGCDTTCPSCS